MKKSLSMLCLLCGGTALLCLCRSAQLEGRLDELDEKYTHFHDSLCGGPRIQSNLFVNNRWAYQGFDLETRTATIEVWLTPASRNGDGTVTLMSGSTLYPVPLKDGVYTTLLQLPLFAQTSISCAEFDNEEALAYCENLNWYISPRYQYLPQLNCGLESAPTITAEGDRVAFAYDTTLRISAYDTTGFPLNLENISLVQLQNGIEVKRLPLSGDNQYQGTDSRSNFAASLPLRESFWVTAGTEMTLQVEMVDGQGLRYVSVVDRYTTTADGTASSLMSSGGECSITTLEGEMLYDPQAPRTGQP